MSTTRTTGAAVLSLAFLLVAGTASAGPVREGDARVDPPADGPDLSMMALTRGDTYGTVTKEGYVRPGKGIVATYIRTFAGASGGGGNPLLYLESRVNLLRSASEAQRLLDTRVRRLGTSEARTKLRRTPVFGPDPFASSAARSSTARGIERSS